MNLLDISDLLQYHGMHYDVVETFYLLRPYTSCGSTELSFRKFLSNIFDRKRITRLHGRLTQLLLHDYGSSEDSDEYRRRVSVYFHVVKTVGPANKDWEDYLWDAVHDTNVVWRPEYQDLRSSVISVGSPNVSTLCNGPRLSSSQLSLLAYLIREDPLRLEYSDREGDIMIPYVQRKEAVPYHIILHAYGGML